jgi:hypothetical protein
LSEERRVLRRGRPAALAHLPQRHYDRDHGRPVNAGRHINDHLAAWEASTWSYLLVLLRLSVQGWLTPPT